MRKVLLFFVAISIALCLEAENNRFPCFGYAIGRCNVRRSPSTKSSIVFEIEDEEEVQVEKRKGNFYYIYAMRRGWGWTHVSNLQLGETFDDDDDYDDDDDETSGQEQILKNIAMPIARAIAQAGYGKITDQSYYGYWCRISVDVKRPVEGLRVDYILRDAVYYTTDEEIIRDQEFYSKRWYTYEKYTDHWGVPGYDIEIERNTRYKTMYITVEEE